MNTVKTTASVWKSASVTVSSKATSSTSLPIRAQIDPLLHRPLQDFVAAARSNRMTPTVSKNSPFQDIDAVSHHRRGKVLGHRMRGRAMACKPFGPVIDGVHRGYHREEHLRRADIARGLVAADVLLPRLEREPVGGVAVRVFADSHQTPRHEPLEGILHGHVGRVRAAEAHRHAEALRRADGDVRPEFPRRTQHREGKDIRGDDGQRARRVRALR